MSKTALDELQGILFKKLPNDWYHHVDIQGVPQASIHKDAVESIMGTISDWHNKQVEAVLDRLEARLTEEASGIRQIKTDYAYGFTAANDQTNEAIEAERDKLMERGK